MAFDIDSIEPVNADGTVDNVVDGRHPVKPAFEPMRRKLRVAPDV